MRTVEEILEEMRALVAAADGRNLTDEESNTYEDLEAQLAALRRSEGIRARQVAYSTPVPGDLAAVAHAVPPKPEGELDRAFNHYMRTGQPNQDIAGLRNAQSVGTDTAGGFTVPEGFRQKLVERLKAFGGLANEAEVITTASGNRLPFPTLDDTANEGEIAAEGSGGAGGADLVFGERELNAFKYVAPGTGALPLRVSVELLQDSAFDIEGLVSRKLGERIARAQADDWVNGTGTGEPEGIIQSTGPSKTFTTAAITKDDLIDVVHLIDPAYRMSAVWVFNDSTLATVRKLEDTTGRPLWEAHSEAGLEGLPGGVLLGHRVVIDQAFADNVDASGNTWGAFGDIRETYVIRRVQDVTLIVNPFTRANEGQVEYTLWARADGAIQQPNSVALMNNDAV